MMKRYPGWNWSSIFARTFATGGAITLTGCLAIAFSGSRALAQDLPIVPDGLNTLVDNNLKITGGTTVGKNLFHSFSSFSVPFGQTALFDNANVPNIVNIFGRVTGKSQSFIDGTIASSSPVNLFLMNPNGIIFGQNARLDIGGSFVGTTAHAIGFPGDGKFPHHSPIVPNNPLLAVNPNALFFNKTPAGVSVISSKLEVQPGQNLFLVGGNVIVQDGKLTAPSGRIELGGLAEAGEVRIEYVSDSSNPTGNFPNARLLFHDDLDQANVSLTNTTIDASKAGRRAGSAGDVFIVGDRISVAQSNIFSNGKEGRIELNARDQVSIVNSQIKTRGFDDSSSLDFAGLIKIAATEGSVLVNQSTLSTTNPVSGYAGDISISARDQVSIVNSSGDNGIFSQGNLGNIFIGGDLGNPDYDLLTPRTVTITNSTLQTNGLGSGSAGDIIIRAHDQIAVENNSQIRSESKKDTTSGGFGSLKLAATEGSVLLNQSTLSTTNSSTGYAGDISISARDEVSILNQSNVLSNGYFGRIVIGKSDRPGFEDSFSPRTVRIDDSTVRAESTVNIAGEISIDATDSISISNIPIAQDSRSRFSTNARGNGVDAGDISLKAGNSVSIANSSITSELDPGITGNAGTIEVEAGSISLTNKTELRTLIYGNGSAGDITLETHGGSVSMDNSTIFSTVEPGGNGLGGNIEIYTGSLTMSNAAQLQTLIRGGGKGEAGVIFVETNGGSVSLTGSRTGMFSTINEGADGRTRDTGFLGNLDFINGDISRAILIDTGTLSLTEGATLNTSTYGIGNAGAVVVVADGNVSLKGGTIGSFVGTQATGDAGAILMKVGSLSIASTSQYAAGLTTETLGQGDAGAIVVLADKDISIRGNESGNESVIASRVAQGTANTSGYIRLDARSLFLRDGGAVNVNNQGLGLAGDIRINMREDIILRDQGEISAIANSGIGGNIFLNSGDFLVLVNGSQVSTQVGAGDGGNVDVNTRYIIAAPFKNNNIDAFAQLGTGGAIDITANRLYDISERADVPVSNDIDPTARSGVNGTLTATVLNLDPTQGLSNLPAEAVDPTRLIAETCAPRGGITERQKNQFIVTQRGGLPPDPNAAFPGEAVVTDQGTPNQQNNQPDNLGSTNSTSATPTAIASPQPPENQPDRPGSSNSTSATPIATASPQPPENQPDRPGSSNPTVATPTAIASPQQPIVEAQGWVYEKNGDIKFTNEAPTVIPNRSELIPASTCNGLSTKP